jgi:hypothetical protein
MAIGGRQNLSSSGTTTSPTGKLGNAMTRRALNSRLSPQSQFRSPSRWPIALQPPFIAAEDVDCSPAPATKADSAIAPLRL